MREILEEIKVLQNKERRCVPNLQGASPVGCDREGRSYAPWTVRRGRLNRRCCGHGSVLDTDVMMAHARGAHKQRCEGGLEGHTGHEVNTQAGRASAHTGNTSARAGRAGRAHR